jgi:hypothetical protein
MSHSVLVETAKRFVAVFYQALAEGKRVGDAMLAGQRELEDDKSRGRVFGADELNLHDWFVPVLFQEKDDPQLFKTTPAKQTVADFQAALATRLGNLPPVPETGFVGRSRELLALQRLLRQKRFIGAGKIQERVQAVGPEHFGVVAVDCAKRRSKGMLCSFSLLDSEVARGSSLGKP